MILNRIMDQKKKKKKTKIEFLNKCDPSDQSRLKRKCTLQVIHSIFEP